MNLKSGILKEQKRKFIVDENALIRIKGVLDKAAKTLDMPVKIVFRVERKDDRFYETTLLDDVLSDPNMPDKKITLVSVEVRGEEPKRGSLRDWIVRVEFLAEKRCGPRFKDTDEIHIDISTSDKKWALLLADELEPQIERTINHSKLPAWPFVGIGVLGIYILILRLNVFQQYQSVLEQPELFLSIILTVGLLIFMAMTYRLTLSRFIGKPDILVKIFGPESVFLWGEEEKKYREREQTRKNIFWCVLVTFIVSCLASIVVTII